MGTIDFFGFRKFLNEKPHNQKKDYKYKRNNISRFFN